MLQPIEGARHACRILLAALSAEDAEHIQQVLQSIEAAPIVYQVFTAQRLQTCLSRNNWDLVVAGDDLRDFSGLDVLHILKALGRPLPCVVVSRIPRSGRAAACLQAGATEYLVEDCPERLRSVLGRELRLIALQDQVGTLQTRLNAAEETLRRTAHGALLSQIVPRLAGALQQCLASISNYSAGCAMRLEGTELSSALREVADEAVRAGVLVQALLRMMRGKDSERQPLDLNRLVQQAVDLAVLAGGAGDDWVVTDLADDLPLLSGYGTELQQAFASLLLEATNPDEKAAAPLRISTQLTESDQVVISLTTSRNTGFADALLDRVALASESGFAAIRSIIAKHGGQIQLSAGATGELTCEFVFPAACQLATTA